MVERLFNRGRLFLWAFALVLEQSQKPREKRHSLLKSLHWKRYFVQFPLIQMKVFIVLALFLATVSGQFGFNPFRLFGGRRPSRPASRPAPRPTSFRTAPATAPAAGGARSCNQGFHVSSQHFSWQGARNYCTSNGMRASSLETQAKVGTAYNLVRPLKYFWTGGSVNHGRRTVSWPNGATSTPDWSPTGG